MIKKQRFDTRPRISDALAGLDVLNLANSTVSAADLAAGVPADEIADVHQFALELTDRVFTEPEDTDNREYWATVAACLKVQLDGR